MLSRTIRAAICLFPLVLLLNASVRAAEVLDEGRYYVYLGDRGAWLNKLNSMGVTNIGTESFDNFGVGHYTTSVVDVGCPGGCNAGFTAPFDITMLPGNGNVLSWPGVVVGFSVPYPIAMGFDVQMEANSAEAPPNILPPADFIELNGNSLGHFVTPVPGGSALFIGIIVKPGMGVLTSVSISPSDLNGNGASPYGLVLLKNVSYPNGPTSTQSNPVHPSGPCGDSCYVYPVPTGPAWFDPPLANGFEFSSNSAKFTAINDFPTGFTGGFAVSVGGTLLGVFGPGQAVQFPSGGVSDFIITGITPAVDGSSPTAFPIDLSLDTVGATFNMQAIPTSVQPLSSSEILVAASGLAYSRVSKTFNGTVTITNASSSTINGPFQVVFSSLTAGVSVTNPTGTFSGWPYMTAPVNSLAQGESATINVQFSNPAMSKINFTPVVYSGSLN